MYTVNTRMTLPPILRVIGQSRGFGVVGSPGQSHIQIPLASSHVHSFIQDKADMPPVLVGDFTEVSFWCVWYFVKAPLSEPCKSPEGRGLQRIHSPPIHTHTQVPSTNNSRSRKRNGTEH